MTAIVHHLHPVPSVGHYLRLGHTGHRKLEDLQLLAALRSIVWWLMPPILMNRQNFLILCEHQIRKLFLTHKLPSCRHLADFSLALESCHGQIPGARMPQIISTEAGSSIWQQKSPILPSNTECMRFCARHTCLMVLRMRGWQSMLRCVRCCAHRSTREEQTSLLSIFRFLLLIRCCWMVRHEAL